MTKYCHITVGSCSTPTHTHTHTHTKVVINRNARTHASTHARTHARTHTHTGKSTMHWSGITCLYRCVTWSWSHNHYHHVVFSDVNKVIDNRSLYWQPTDWHVNRHDVIINQCVKSLEKRAAILVGWTPPLRAPPSCYRYPRNALQALFHTVILTPRLRSNLTRCTRHHILVRTNRAALHANVQENNKKGNIFTFALWFLFLISFGDFSAGTLVIDFDGPIPLLSPCLHTHTHTHTRLFHPPSSHPLAPDYHVISGESAERRYLHLLTPLGSPPDVVITSSAVKRLLIIGWRVVPRDWRSRAVWRNWQRWWRHNEMAIFLIENGYDSNRIWTKTGNRAGRTEQQTHKTWRHRDRVSSIFKRERLVLSRDVTQGQVVSTDLTLC